MICGERGDNLWREELVARFTDLYIDEYWATIRLHSAASVFSRKGDRQNIDSLKKAAREYHAVGERIDSLSEGIDNKILYGDLVIGEAIGVAQKIRDERSQRSRLAADLEQVTAQRPMGAP